MAQVKPTSESCLPHVAHVSRWSFACVRPTTPHVKLTFEHGVGDAAMKAAPNATATSHHVTQTSGKFNTEISEPVLRTGAF